MDRSLDQADRRILRELQRDSARSVTEIAEAVGLSHAPCWRRIQRLRAEGVIRRESAIVDRTKLGWDLEFFVYLSFSRHSRPNVKEFRRKMIEHERVIAAYIVLGNFDLMLHVVATTMQDYQDFYLENLSGHPDLGDVTTMTVMATLKEGAIPI